MNQLNYYTQKLTTLTRGNTRYGLAPHKPLLLLSILDIYEDQAIDESKIPLDQKLFDQFATNWQQLFPTERVGDVTMPIYHLKGEGFWKVILQDGSILDRKLSSTKQVIKTTKHGQLEEGLGQLIVDSVTRPLLKMVLLDTYFPDTKQIYLMQRPIPPYIMEMEELVLEERLAKRKTIKREEEVFTRDWKFRDQLLKLYNNTCCISKYQIIPNYKIIEACHIQPHGKFGIDTVTNGIPLSIHLHRAFDSGIISLNDRYEVLVKGQRSFKENDSPFNLRQFKGQQILLPSNSLYFPDLGKLAWHREWFGF